MLVTAGAGYGKSTLLAARVPDDGLVVPATALLRDGVPDGVRWLGVDDVDRVPPVRQRALVPLLNERPELDLVLASRTPIAPALRRGLSGRAVERDAGDLALTPWAVARVLADGYGVPDAASALRVADFSGGWPALVHTCADVLSRDPRADLAAVLGASGAVADWIRTEVLDPLAPDASAVLRAVAGLGPAAPVSPGVADAILAATGCPTRPGLVDDLIRIGVVQRRRRVGCGFEVVGVPAIVAALRVDEPPVAPALLSAMAEAYVGERAWLPAAQAYAAGGDRDGVLRLVAEHGDAMLRRGDAAAFVALVETEVGTDLSGRGDVVARTYADGLRRSGAPAHARRAFAPLAARADEIGWSPGLAARVAAVSYLCGEFEAALEVLDRSPHRPDEERPAGPDAADLVDWLACRTHVLVMLGRPAEARTGATRCLRLAEHVGDPQCLGVAHLAMARVSGGARMDLHGDEAIRYADEAGDAVTATRARQARSSVLLAAARYEAAGAAAREAARLARLACPPGLQAAALHNLGQALARTGELDEALWQLECSVAVCRRLGPARAALGLVGIADLCRSRGHRERARAAYAEAVELARGSGDVQVLVAGLCGSALLAAEDSPDEAGDAAAEGLRLAPHDLRPLALVTAGRVALARGDRLGAAEAAGDAVCSARAERDAERLAEALELEAVAVDDPARARHALSEALSIWAAGGARPDAARVEELIGRLSDADATERSRGRDATRELGRLGLQVPTPEAFAGVGARVRVDVLGPFTVTVDAVPVPLPAWRSRQARTLVKIVTAARGRVVTRDRLCDLLWPDDDPAKTGHRLSVLLATVRGVLDPAKAYPPDRCLVADQTGIRLDLGSVVVDAELLLSDAAQAAELLERGDLDRAREVLRHVDALHRGEAFEDEPEEWADGLREEVRAAWGRSVRRLAQLLLREGRWPEALGLYARLLSVDPYDEQIHRRLVTCLVRAGRHGEARRAFYRWCEAMAELDAPRPDADLLEPAGTSLPSRRSVLTSR